MIIDKIEVNDSYKKYYHKLELRYEQVSQKFRLKNQSLEKQIQDRQKEHENKQTFISSIIKDQKVKQK